MKQRMQGLNARALRRAGPTVGSAHVLRRIAAGGAMSLLLACGACAQSPVQAQSSSDAVKRLAAPAPTPLPLKPNPEFAKFPRYAGTLGSRQIVLRLGAKTDDPSGVHGEYQFADTGEVILIAGDRDGDTLEVEESNDGTRITGNWVGKFAANGSLLGDRMNVDDSDPQPFDLHPLAAGQPAPSAAAKPSAKAAPAAAVPGASAPAGASPPAVGGVSNLTAGE
jgi:hypothetical protein